MSNYGKTYPLGSSEAMKREPRLDEEYYVEYGGYKLYYKRTVLEDMYLEDSIIELQEKGKC